MEDKLSQLKASYKLEAKPFSNEFESLPMPQELICNKIHEFKFMEEQENTSTIASASKPFAGDISTMPVPQTLLKSTNEVLQQSINQIHTVAGLSYDTVNFPLLDEVATKYKSFEVPKQNGYYSQPSHSLT